MGRVNLFVIGVKKAGTSWLYRLLDFHPEIYMCAEKELYYFGNDYPAHRARYHAHFPFDQPFRFFGEATPEYFRLEGVADELVEYNPEAKLLAILRDPIDRLRSEFTYQKQLGNLPESLGLRALIDPVTADFRARSHYEQTLPAFERTFGSSRLMFVSLEQATARTAVVWNTIQDFLGVRRIPPPRIHVRDGNATGSRTFRALYRTLIRPVKTGAPDIYRTMLRSRLMSVLKKMSLAFLGTAHRRRLPKAVHEKLRIEFAPTYRYLHQLGFDRYDRRLHSRTIMNNEAPYTRSVEMPEIHTPT